MVLGDEMREDDPTNLASAWKKASYGLDTVDLRRAWPGPGPAERDVVLLFLLSAIRPEAGGVASLPLLPVPLLPVLRCSGGNCDSDPEDAIMSCGSGCNPGCDVRIFPFS